MLESGIDVAALSKGSSHNSKMFVPKVILCYCNIDLSVSS